MKKNYLIFIYLILCLCFTTDCFSHSSVKEKFAQAIEERLFQIPEFSMIRDWGVDKKIRIWLAGGSAASFASYVQEELSSLPESKERFPYSYYDIYRSTQDADIVIDGNESEAQELESFLRAAKINYLQGSKIKWEVRLLRNARGGTGTQKKDPLLGSPDFRNQNSDSYSTGMLELTTPLSGEGRVRDLFDWYNLDNQFLIDVLEKKVTFYRNLKHSETARARLGYNPEIVSVIRAFTKAFQYGAEISPESVTAIQEIINDFDENKQVSSESVHYILRNAAKLFQHASDVEKAKNELEKYGLRKKLIHFAQTKGDQSLATLLDREPLRSYPVGKAPIIKDIREYRPSFKTAKELNIDIIAHDTTDFLYYENITMSRTGKPNLFVSRENHPIENAIYGWGAYTKIGLVGTHSRGITIRFQVDPNAIEGRDFFIHGDYVVLRNANAVRTMPDDKIKISLFDFFELLEQGKFTNKDKGVLQKLEYKLQSSISRLTNEELLKIKAIVEKDIIKYINTEETSATIGYLIKIENQSDEISDIIYSAINTNINNETQKLNFYRTSGLWKNYFNKEIKSGNSLRLFTLLGGNVPTYVDSYNWLSDFKTAYLESKKYHPEQTKVVILEVLKKVDGFDFYKVAREFMTEEYVADIFTIIKEKIALFKSSKKEIVEHNARTPAYQSYYWLLSDYLASVGKLTPSLVDLMVSAKFLSTFGPADLINLKNGNAVKVLESLSHEDLNFGNGWGNYNKWEARWNLVYDIAILENPIRVREILQDTFVRIKGYVILSFFNSGYDRHDRMQEAIIEGMNLKTKIGDNEFIQFVDFQQFIEKIPKITKQMLPIIVSRSIFSTHYGNAQYFIERAMKDGYIMESLEAMTGKYNERWEVHGIDYVFFHDTIAKLKEIILQLTNRSAQEKEQAAKYFAEFFELNQEKFSKNKGYKKGLKELEKTLQGNGFAVPRRGLCSRFLKLISF